MSYFEEYMEQSFSSSESSQYGKHTDRWVEESSESIYGNSGYCDVHTDEA